GRLGPMDVLDDERDGALAGTPLERLPNRPEDVLRRNCRKRTVELVLGVGFAEDLDQRPVGDALAVRETAAREHRRLVTKHRRQLAGKPRLADSRRTEDGDEVASPARDRPVERAA